MISLVIQKININAENIIQIHTYITTHIYVYI